MWASPHSQIQRNHKELLHRLDSLNNLMLAKTPHSEDPFIEATVCDCSKGSDLDDFSSALKDAFMFKDTYDQKIYT